MTSLEHPRKERLVEKPRTLKSEYRAEIRDRATLEKNLPRKFESLNHIHLSDGVYKRVFYEVIMPNVFTAAHSFRNRFRLSVEQSVEYKSSRK